MIVSLNQDHNLYKVHGKCKISSFQFNFVHGSVYEA